MLKICTMTKVPYKFVEFVWAGSPSVRILIFTCLISDIRFFLTRLPIILHTCLGARTSILNIKATPRIYISPETIRYGDQVSAFGNLPDLQFLFLKNLKAPPGYLSRQIWWIQHAMAMLLFVISTEPASWENAHTPFDVQFDAFWWSWKRGVERLRTRAENWFNVIWWLRAMRMIWASWGACACG